MPALFYRRKLSKEESEQWKTQLKRKEKVDFSGFWYPEDLIRANMDHYLIFDEDEVSEEEEAQLNEIIKGAIGDYYYIFNEDGITYELEKETFDLFNIGTESYLTGKEMDWLVYYCHEDFYIIRSQILKRKITLAFPKLIDSMNRWIKK